MYQGGTPGECPSGLAGTLTSLGRNGLNVLTSSNQVPSAGSSQFYIVSLHFQEILVSSM